MCLWTLHVSIFKLERRRQQGVKTNTTAINRARALAIRSSRHRDIYTKGLSHAHLVTYDA